MTNPTLAEEIASHLLALRDDEGNDPFIRYQMVRCSKGFLRHLIAEFIASYLTKEGYVKRSELRLLDEEVEKLKKSMPWRKMQVVQADLIRGEE